MHKSSTLSLFVFLASTLAMLFQNCSHVSRIATAEESLNPDAIAPTTRELSFEDQSFLTFPKDENLLNTSFSLAGRWESQKCLHYILPNGTKLFYRDYLSLHGHLFRSLTLFYDSKSCARVTGSMRHEGITAISSIENGSAGQLDYSIQFEKKMVGVSTRFRIENNTLYFGKRSYSAADGVLPFSVSSDVERPRSGHTPLLRPTEIDASVPYAYFRNSPNSRSRNTAFSKE